MNRYVESQMMNIRTICWNIGFDLIFILATLALPTFAISEETYVFERMWPTLQQPWYFSYPTGVAIDSKDNVYIGGDPIYKLTRDGQVITIAQGGLIVSDIAIDRYDNLYVAVGRNADNGSIYKFDSTGNHIAFWENWGANGGTRQIPAGIATGRYDNVYVTDSENHCVYKLNSDGELSFRWGSQGSGEGQFENPWGIAVDDENNVWVVDTGNRRIQTFDGDGIFTGEYEISADGDDQIRWPRGILIDREGDIFISVGSALGNWGPQEVHKYDEEFTYITKYGGHINGDVQFFEPTHMAIDRTGNLYVADSANNRIQVFTQVVR